MGGGGRNLGGADFTFASSRNTCTFSHKALLYEKFPGGGRILGGVQPAENGVRNPPYPPPQDITASHSKESKEIPDLCSRPGFFCASLAHLESQEIVMYVLFLLRSLTCPPLLGILLCTFRWHSPYISLYFPALYPCSFSAARFARRKGFYVRSWTSARARNSFMCVPLISPVRSGFSAEPDILFMCVPGA